VIVILVLLVIAVLGALVSFALVLGALFAEPVEEGFVNPTEKAAKKPAAVRCTGCGSEQPAGNRFCGQCGAPLAKQA